MKIVKRVKTREKKYRNRKEKCTREKKRVKKREKKKVGNKRKGSYPKTSLVQVKACIKTVFFLFCFFGIDTVCFALLGQTSYDSGLIFARI